MSESDGPELRTVLSKNKYSSKVWSVRLLSPLVPVFLGWLVLMLHGFGEYLRQKKRKLFCVNNLAGFLPPGFSR